MTSHGVAPPGLSAGKSTLSLGSRPRLFDVVPPGLKMRNFKTYASGYDWSSLTHRVMKLFLLLRLGHSHRIEGFVELIFGQDLLLLA